MAALFDQCVLVRRGEHTACCPYKVQNMCQTCQTLWKVDAVYNYERKTKFRGQVLQGRWTLGALTPLRSGSRVSVNFDVGAVRTRACLCGREHVCALSIACMRQQYTRGCLYASGAPLAKKRPHSIGAYSCDSEEVNP